MIGSNHYTFPMPPKVSELPVPARIEADAELLASCPKLNESFIVSYDDAQKCSEKSHQGHKNPKKMKKKLTERFTGIFSSEETSETLQNSNDEFSDDVRQEKIIRRGMDNLTTDIKISSTSDICPTVGAKIQKDRYVTSTKINSTVGEERCNLCIEQKLVKQELNREQLMKRKAVDETLENRFPLKKRKIKICAEKCECAFCEISDQENGICCERAAISSSEVDQDLQSNLNLIKMKLLSVVRCIWSIIDSLYNLILAFTGSWTQPTKNLASFDCLLLDNACSIMKTFNQSLTELNLEVKSKDDSGRKSPRGTHMNHQQVHESTQEQYSLKRMETMLEKLKRFIVELKQEKNKIPACCGALADQSILLVAEGEENIEKACK